MFQLHKASQKKRKKKERIKEQRNNLKIGNKVANFKLNIEERDFFCIHFCEGGRFDPSQQHVNKAWVVYCIILFPAQLMRVSMSLSSKHWVAPIHSLVHRRSSQSSVAGVSFSQKLPKYEAIFYCLVKRTFTKKFKTLWSRCRKDECADRSCLCGILFSLYLHYSSPWWVLKLKALEPRAVELIYKAKTLTCKMILSNMKVFYCKFGYL